jgi:type I restriction enzyme, S subunit
LSDLLRGTKRETDQANSNYIKLHGLRAFESLPLHRPMRIDPEVIIFGSHFVRTFLKAGLPKAIADLFPDTLDDSQIGEIPRGWHVGRVEDIAEINALMLSRTDLLPVIDYIEISEVMQGNIATVTRYKRGTEPSRARRRLRHGDTVLSTVRPNRGAYFLALNPPETLIASTGFAVLSPKSGNWAFLYSLANRREVGDHLGRLADGGAYPAIRPEIISNIAVALPPSTELILRFEHLVRPFYEKAAKNRDESKTLTQVRDALLPKLISSELRVPEAERILRRHM